MSTISNNDIARSIYLASKDQSDLVQFSKQVTQFLNRKRLLSKSKDILSNLNKIINQEEGIVEIRVTSGKVLGEKEKHDLMHVLAKRYNAKDTSMIYKVDERLVGGYKIEVNDEVIDLSIKNKINKLQEHLIKSA